MSPKVKKSDDRLANRLVTTPIAIIGMASIFPKARTTQEYWDNILHKIDCVSDVPVSRWNAADYYDPDPTTPDKTYNKRGGFIPDVDFDPVEFGLPPNILEVTDVSQLLSLVVAKEALEDAGYASLNGNGGREFDRENTGVILGVVGISSKLFTPLMARLQYPVWKKAMLSSGLPETDADAIVEKIKASYVGWEESSFPGTIVNVIAGRIANRFDLGGSNCVVDAACASSLAAVRMAAAELIEGRAKMMITGGVDTDNSIGTYLCFSKTPAFSRGDRVRTFDETSDGMMVGEGIGMLVLKRLEDAERDGDQVYAVIKAIGSSSDGRFKSIYAPRPAGQAIALRRAYAEAGFDPLTIGLVEAHGTGTPAGDPAEVESLREVFKGDGMQPNSIALGSVKSQIAHTKAAAGVASLIKTTLALRYKVLPPTINVEKPNPKLGLTDSPFYLNTEPRPWMRAEQQPPRRAAVSSFGFGGTNFHVVMEEFSSPEGKALPRLQTVDHRLLLSAPTPAELLRSIRQMASGLKSEGAGAHFAEWLRSSRSPRIPATTARLGLVAADLAEAIDLLDLAGNALQQDPGVETWEHPRGIYYRKSGLEPAGKVVALFAGQGSQSVNMGRELCIDFPEARQAFESFDQLFLNGGQPPLSTNVFPPPVFDAAGRDAQNETLTRTEFAQPAIGALSVGQYRLLRQAGFRPDFTAGHSFGELTALWAAGVLDDAAYFNLARARGKAMAPPPDPAFDAGGMLAVKGEVARIQALLPQLEGISLANYNSNEQVVLAGPRQALEKARQSLTAAGFSAIPLSVSAAFHTPLVGHAQAPFEQAIRQETFHTPQVSVFSNSTGRAYSRDPQEIQTALARHILQPVLYRDEIEAIYAAGGRIFVEFGPKNVQANLVHSILGDREHVVVSLNPNPRQDSDHQFRAAVVQLQVAGIPLEDVDPYERLTSAQPQQKLSPAAVTLNGGYYLSQKTRTAMEKAMHNGHTIHTNDQTPIPDFPETSHPHGNGSRPAPILAPVPASQPATASPAAVSPDTLRQLIDHQQETLRIHSRYLETQSGYAQVFSELTRLGYAQAEGADRMTEPQIRAVESIEHSLDRFQDYQADTLQVHQQFLSTQADFTRTLFDYLRAAPATSILAVNPALAVDMPIIIAEEPLQIPSTDISAPVLAPAPVPVAIPPLETALSTENLTAALLIIVADKTGYPTEMLDAGMDMEADLGIDSIKRVEILSAVQAEFPQLPPIDTTALAETRTLGQVVELIQRQVGSQALSASASIEPTADPAPVLIQENQPDSGQLTSAFLDIVAEKTGYPAEMLDLDMDMEADLGIDSIKRVEILGAMQTQYPDRPKVEPAALGELRSLRQVLDQMASAAPSGSQPANSVVPSSPVEPEPALPIAQLSIESLPAPDRLEYTFPADQVVLVHSDGSGLAAALAQALDQRGWKTAVLHDPGSDTQVAAVTSVHLEDIGEAAIERALSEIQANVGPIGGYIHLQPTLSGSTDGFLSKASEELVRLAFLTAGRLKDSLDQASSRGRAWFLAVTHLDGLLGQGDSSAVDPASSGLFGLVKSLAREWEDVHCRGVDLAPEMSLPEAVAAILAEIDDPDRLIDVVGYGPRGRVTSVVAPLPAGD